MTLVDLTSLVCLWFVRFDVSGAIFARSPMASDVNLRPLPCGGVRSSVSTTHLRGKDGAAHPSSSLSGQSATEKLHQKPLEQVQSVVASAASPILPVIDSDLGPRESRGQVSANQGDLQQGTRVRQHATRLKPHVMIHVAVIHVAAGRSL